MTIKIAVGTTFSWQVMRVRHGYADICSFLCKLFLVDAYNQ